MCQKMASYLPFFICFILSAFRYLSLGQEKQVELLNHTLFERELSGFTVLVKWADIFAILPLYYCKFPPDQPVQKNCKRPLC